MTADQLTGPARRALTPEQHGEVGFRVRAGEVNGDDVGRLVELDFAWTESSPVQHVAGRLTRYRSDSLGVLLNIAGDPSWPEIEGILLDLDHQVALGPYADGSGS